MNNKNHLRPSSSIPVLLAGSQRQADGYVSQRGLWEVANEDSDEPVSYELDDIPVCELSENALLATTDKRKRAKLEQRFSKRMPDTDWDRLYAVQGLVDAFHFESRIDKKELEAVRPALAAYLAENLGGGVISETQAARELDEARENPVMYFGKQFGSLLRSSELVVWYDNRIQRVRPGLLCPDLLTGLSALLATGLDSKQGIAFCKNCGKKFHRHSRWMSYCSPSCGSAVRVRRHRKRENTGK